MTGRAPPVRIERRFIDGTRVASRHAAGRPRRDWPPVVLVHGMVISSAYWVPLLRLLGAEFPATAPDLPGFGLSAKPHHVLDISESADALVAWMDAAGLRQAVLVGNSLGCQVVIDAAFRHPQRVVGVVLQGPTVDRHARSLPRQLWRMIANSRQEPVLGMLPWIDYARAGPRRVALTARHALRDWAELKLPNIRVPALVVVGTRDVLTPPQWADEVARLLPCARLAVVPGAAHTFNFLAPEKLLRVPLPFLCAVAEGRAGPR